MPLPCPHGTEEVGHGSVRRAQGIAKKDRSMLGSAPSPQRDEARDSGQAVIRPPPRHPTERGATTANDGKVGFIDKEAPRCLSPLDCGSPWLPLRRCLPWPGSAVPPQRPRRCAAPSPPRP